MSSKGTVKWYNPSKKMGFITPDEGGGDVFIREESLRPVVEDDPARTPGRDQAAPLRIEDGQRVTFEITRSKSGQIMASALRAE